jgi:limonene-1,2-epoxide hydrolase
MTPEAVLRAELGAWGHLDADEAMSYFAEDAVWDIGPSFPPLSGRDAIRNTIAAYFSSGASHIDMRILHLAVDGNVVLMERLDHWSEWEDDRYPRDGCLRGQEREDHCVAGVLHPTQLIRNGAQQW